MLTTSLSGHPLADISKFSCRLFRYHLLQLSADTVPWYVNVSCMRPRVNRLLALIGLCSRRPDDSGVDSHWTSGSIGFRPGLVMSLHSHVVPK